MGKKAECMKYDLKISLPFYKVLYALVFIIIIVMIRGISSGGEIIVAIEPNVALLAGVFMADNYDKEYTTSHIQMFYRYPLQKKYIAVLRRFCVNWIYLMVLVGVAYAGFILVYDRVSFSAGSGSILVMSTFIASGISIFFMGALSFTITNFMQNMGVGIGAAFLIWGGLNSSLAKSLPPFLQLFLVNEKYLGIGNFTPCYVSRIFYFIIAIGLLELNIYSLQRQPKYRKKWGFKNGNKN